MCSFSQYRCLPVLAGKSVLDDASPVASVSRSCSSCSYSRPREANTKSRRRQRLRSFNADPSLLKKVCEILLAQLGSLENADFALFLLARVSFASGFSVLLLQVYPPPSTHAHTMARFAPVVPSAHWVIRKLGPLKGAEIGGYYAAATMRPE